MKTYSLLTEFWKKLLRQMGSVAAQCVRKSAGRLLKLVEAGTGDLLQDNKVCLRKLQNHWKQDLHGEISSVYFLIWGRK